MIRKQNLLKNKLWIHALHLIAALLAPVETSRYICGMPTPEISAVHTSLITIWYGLTVEEDGIISLDDTSVCRGQDTHPQWKRHNESLQKLQTTALLFQN